VDFSYFTSVFFAPHTESMAPLRRNLQVHPILPLGLHKSLALLTTPPSYVPYTPENAAINACGMPIPYNASKEWADKKVILFSVPGAFTPPCSIKHAPGYMAHLKEIKAKGVDVVACIAYNDPFVMSAWSKAHRVKDDESYFAACQR